MNPEIKVYVLALRRVKQMPIVYYDELGPRDRATTDWTVLGTCKFSEERSVDEWVIFQCNTREGCYYRMPRSHYVNGGLGRIWGEFRSLRRLYV